MGLFDIFKKKQSQEETRKSQRKKELTEQLKDFSILIDLIKENKIKIPQLSYSTASAITEKEFLECDKAKDTAFRTTSFLSKEKRPFLVGVIETYHPYPKDLAEASTALVQWPVHGKNQKIFNVDCSALASFSIGSYPKSLYNVTYPKPGSWIWFCEYGKSKDTDGLLRSYGIAQMVFDYKSLKLAKVL